MPAPFLTLEDAARVAGHARWLEGRLFEVVGEWSAAEPDPAAKAMLSTHSLHHAWHAEVWRDRLPRVAHLDGTGLTRPAGPRAVALVDTLAATTEPSRTVERVAALARLVLPALLAAYRARLDAAHPLADGPTVHWLGHVVADEGTALAEAEVRLEGLLREGGSGAAERASAYVADLDPGGGAAGWLIGLARVAQA